MRLQAGRVWRALVPVVCLLAGVGFAATARDARGTELRSPGTAGLVGLVRTAESRVADLTSTSEQLEQRLEALTAQAGRSDADVADAQAKVNPLLLPGARTKVSGEGIVVVLNDAPQDNAVAGVDANQLVVHQSDMQAVVNALWAGGAQAMSIAGQRIVATSAVRCVGNTLLLNGQVFSPPFRVEAIGPSDRMKQRLDASAGVQLFRQAADYYGLGYSVTMNQHLQLPAYGEPPVLSYARPAGR